MTIPSRQERLRPIEFVALSAIVAFFIGLVVLMSSRNFESALIFCGISFIVSLVVIAMLAMAAQPSAAEKDDLSEQEGSTGQDGSAGGH